MEPWLKLLYDVVSWFYTFSRFGRTPICVRQTEKQQTYGHSTDIRTSIASQGKMSGILFMGHSVSLSCTFRLCLNCVAKTARKSCVSYIFLPENLETNSSYSVPVESRIIELSSYASNALQTHHHLHFAIGNASKLSAWRIRVPHDVMSVESAPNFR